MKEGVLISQGPPAPKRGGTGCNGDVNDKDGGHHPWRLVGEDSVYEYYECPVCGAQDRT